jgi:predicted transcriptional regulator
MRDNNQIAVPPQINTRQLARLIGRSPGYIRNSLCAKGHFWNVVPVRTPSGSLLWNLEVFKPYFVAKIPSESEVNCFYNNKGLSLGD